jgi:hypothetical protein
MDIYLTKTLNGFQPADEQAKQAVKRWKLGETLKCSVKKPRDYTNHKRYFALLNLTYENQERYTNFHMFRKAVELAAGHVDEIITLDGEVHYEVRSIDYSTLDEFQFDELFGRVMRVCVDNFLQGVEAEQLRYEVERFAA